jgi:RHS repeat-associated protein
MITITNSSLKYSSNSGVSTGNATGVSGNVNIVSSEISKNNGKGVEITGTFTTSVLNSVFEGNSGDGIYLNHNQPVDIRNNVITNGLQRAMTLTVNGQAVSLLGNSGTGNKYNVIYLDGTVDDIILPPQGNLVYLYGNITVPTGKTMTLQPGTIIKLNSGAMIWASGTLNGQGTAGNPVVITSYKDDSYGGDSNGDGTASVPAQADWVSIMIVNGNVTLDHAIVQYGGGGFTTCHTSYPNNSYGMISNHYSGWCGSFTNNAMITITNSSLKYSSNSGVYLGNDTGISASAVVHNSNIVNNTSYGIYSSFSPRAVDATNNWWGADTGPDPYGTGNGINYRTYTCGTPPVTCYDYDYYVRASPWVGTPIETAANNNGQSILWQAFVAEPVNTATGNYIYEDPDLSIPTRSLPLAFTRSYNSLLPQNGRLGYGWTFAYNVTITENGTDGSATVTYGDGRTVKFTKSGDVYTPPPGTFSTLTKTGLLFSLTEKDQTVYHFDSLNRLYSIADKNGNVTSLNYTGTQLAAVAAPDGRSLGFTYDGSNRITQVLDPIGRTAGFGYDANGDLATYTDPRGKVTTYAYDTSHRLTSITDANGHTFVTNTYDSAGRVVEQRDAESNLTTFVYDTTAHKTTVTTPLGATIYQYDEQLRLTSVTDPMTHTESYTYDAANNRISLTDKRGNTTTYTYDGRGIRLTTTKPPDPLPDVTTNTYDSRNNLLTSTDALNRLTTYDYDANNNLISKTVTPDGVVNYSTSYTYYNDASRNGLLETITDPRSLVTTYDYNSHGDNTSTLDAAGGTSTRTYDTAGRLLTSADPLGHTTSYTYNANNQVLTVTDPELGVTTNTYDEVGNLLTTQDPNLHTTTRTYTVKDQLETVEDAAGYVTTYGYDAVGNRTSVTDGNNHTTHYTYDAASRLTGVTDPLGKTTTYGYDGNGNRISVRDANTHTTSYTFDKLNRQTGVTDALTHATLTTYDLVGNIKSIEDANHHTTYYDYDRLNRLIKVTDARSGEVTYTYDEDGNRRTMLDANDHTTEYTYDALNRLHTEADPMSHTWTYEYDAAGRRISKLDAKDVTTSYAYDDADRLTGITAPSISISYSYDPAGNRLSMLDASGTTTYTYDEINRPVSIAQPEGTITYVYDAVNRTDLTLPGSLTTTYTYNEADHLTDVTDWSTHNTHYTYDDAGRLSTTTYPNGVVTTNTYDNADRLTGIATVKSATTILSISYMLDDVGNRLTMVDGSGTTSYTYDELNRLTGVTYPSGTPASVSYTYDAMGNRLTMVQDGVTTTYTYDAADRLTGTTGGSSLSFTWDDNGQMLTKGSQTFAWDALGRMVGLINGGTTASYVYNVDGVRTGKIVDGVSTDYLQDLAAGLPVVMAETTGSVTSQYVYGSDLIAQVNGSTPVYYHADGLGSTRAMTDSTGVSTDQYTYDAFGVTRSHTGISSQIYTFTGEQNDPEAGLIFLRARYFDPSIAVYLSKDIYPYSFFNSVELNRYVYTGQNPINRIDPSGHFFTELASLFIPGFGIFEKHFENPDAGPASFNMLPKYAPDIVDSLKILPPGTIDAISFGISVGNGEFFSFQNDIKFVKGISSEYFKYGKIFYDAIKNSHIIPHFFKNLKDSFSFLKPNPVYAAEGDNYSSGNGYDVGGSWGGPPSGGK